MIERFCWRMVIR